MMPRLPPIQPDLSVEPVEPSRPKFESAKSLLEQNLLDAKTHPDMLKRRAAAIDFLSSGVTWWPNAKRDVDYDNFISQLKKVRVEISPGSLPDVHAFTTPEEEPAYEVVGRGGAQSKHSDVRVHDLSLVYEKQIVADAYGDWEKLIWYVDELSAKLREYGVLRAEDDEEHDFLSTPTPSSVPTKQRRVSLELPQELQEESEEGAEGEDEAGEAGEDDVQ